MQKQEEVSSYGIKIFKLLFLRSSVSEIPYCVRTFFFFLIFPNKFCARNFANTGRPISTFFAQIIGRDMDFLRLWKFFLLSLPVSIYGSFCKFLRPFLCTADLKNYQIYEYEIFRICRLLFEIVPIVGVLRLWRQ